MWNMLVYSFWAVCFLSQMIASMGCYVPPIEEKFFFSDVFAYGRIKKHYRGRFLLPETRFQTEVELFCTFKGGPLPSFINISMPDYRDDPCMKNKLKRGRKYLLYLDATDGIYRLAFNARTVTENEGVDYIAFLCDVDIQYPEGVDETTAKEYCPEPYPDFPDCTPYDPTKSSEYDYYDETDTQVGNTSSASPQPNSPESTIPSVFYADREQTGETKDTEENTNNSLVLDIKNTEYTKGKEYGIVSAGSENVTSLLELSDSDTKTPVLTGPVSSSASALYYIITHTCVFISQYLLRPFT